MDWGGVSNVTHQNNQGCVWFRFIGEMSLEVLLICYTIYINKQSRGEQACQPHECAHGTLLDSLNPFWP